jgi:hypothetical protein
MVLTQKQLSERKNFIGSSEAKIIADGSYDAWAKLISEKKGEQKRLFTKQTQFLMDTGSYLESYILDTFASTAKIKIGMRGSGRTLDYHNVPIHSTYDAVASDGIPVEAKFHSGFMSMDEICDLYSPQCQHHMHTSAKDYCYVAVLFGVHCRFEYRRVERDHSWLNMYLDQCKQFWNWYTKDIVPDSFSILPPVDWTDQITINMSDLECWDSQMQADMNLHAQDIIEASKATKIADKAKSEIKHYLPHNCRKMVLDLSGNLNGDKIVVTRSKNDKITLTYQPRKEDKNDI